MGSCACALQQGGDSTVTQNRVQGVALPILLLPPVLLQKKKKKGNEKGPKIGFLYPSFKAGRSKRPRGALLHLQKGGQGISYLPI